jgi:uncharacterized membrane protein YkoI
MISRVRFILLVMLVAAAIMGALPVLAQGDGPYNPVIDPNNFVEGVDNPYFPLTPGTTFIYEGETEDGTEHIEVLVTDDTKVILGVECVVVRDTVSVDGEMTEDTYDWYAQDVEGNVWYMGEDTKEYENGEVVGTAGSWEAGVDGAKPGIVMQAAPPAGEPYRQEYYAGEAEDMAQVISLIESARVPYGSYDNLLVTKEWTPLEPGIAENKYYAAGVGLVLEETVQGGSDRTELIDIVAGSSDDDQEDEAEGDASESEEAGADDQHDTALGTPALTAADALRIAEAYLNAGSATQVELDDENGQLVYSVEIGTSEVKVDAMTGEVLGVETDED